MKIGFFKRRMHCDSCNLLALPASARQTKSENCQHFQNFQLNEITVVARDGAGGNGGGGGALGYWTRRVPFFFNNYQNYSKQIATITTTTITRVITMKFHFQFVCKNKRAEARTYPIDVGRTQSPSQSQ